MTPSVVRIAAADMAGSLVSPWVGSAGGWGAPTARGASVERGSSGRSRLAAAERGVGGLACAPPRAVHDVAADGHRDRSVRIDADRAAQPAGCAHGGERCAG